MPRNALPEMDVAVDEARHCDHAAAVDLDHRPAAEVSADGYDLAVIDEQIAGLGDPDLRIHRNDRCALDPDAPQHGVLLTWPVGPASAA
jgi:hypothetical protein